MIVNSYQFKSGERNNNQIVSLVWNWTEVSSGSAEKVFFEKRPVLFYKSCQHAKSNTWLRNFLLLLALQTLFQSLNWFLWALNQHKQEQHPSHHNDSKTFWNFWSEFLFVLIISGLLLNQRVFWQGESFASRTFPKEMKIQISRSQSPNLFNVKSQMPKRRSTSLMI